MTEGVPSRPGLIGRQVQPGENRRVPFSEAPQLLVDIHRRILPGALHAVAPIAGLLRRALTCVGLRDS